VARLAAVLVLPALALLLAAHFFRTGLIGLAAAAFLLGRPVARRHFRRS
jgi:hypothetical protein